MGETGTLRDPMRFQLSVSTRTGVDAKDMRRLQGRRPVGFWSVGVTASRDLDGVDRGISTSEHSVTLRLARPWPLRGANADFLCTG